MTYISTRDRFIEECVNEGLDLDDAIFLADTQFDETGEPLPESIYATYRKPH